MQNVATYWRARLDAIQQIITEEKGGDRSEKNNSSVLLRNGIVPVELKSRFENVFEEHQRAWIQSQNKQPLSFSEITRFNTWFLIHPEKVAGKEVVTTSREFPISIKGSEADIHSTINKTLQSEKDKLFDKNTHRMRIIKAKSEAKLKLLNLLKV